MRTFTQQEVNEICRGHLNYIYNIGLNADCQKAVFSEADLRGLSFINKDLQNVSFRNSLLDGADFSGANLFRCDFRGASGLDSVVTDFATSFFYPRCPDQGAFECYTKGTSEEIGEEVIIKLSVPFDAERTGGTTNIFRVKEAVILNITSFDGSRRLYEAKYKNKRVSVGDKLTDNFWKEDRFSPYMESALYCVLTRQEAVNRGL